MRVFEKINSNNARCVCCNAVNNIEIETDIGQYSIVSFVLNENNEVVCMDCVDAINECNSEFEDSDEINYLGDYDENC